MSMMNRDYSRAKYSKDAHEKLGIPGESATVAMLESYGFTCRHRPRGNYGVDLEAAGESSVYLVETECVGTERRWPHDLDTFKYNPLHIPMAKKDNALKYGKAIYVWWRSDLNVCACHYSTDINGLPKVLGPYNYRKKDREWFLAVDKSMVSYWYRGRANESFWKNLMPSTACVQPTLF